LPGRDLKDEVYPEPGLLQAVSSGDSILADNPANLQIAYNSQNLLKIIKNNSCWKE
jgi:hypothetical protein